MNEKEMSRTDWLVVAVIAALIFFPKAVAGAVSVFFTTVLTVFAVVAAIAAVAFIVKAMFQPEKESTEFGLFGFKVSF